MRNKNALILILLILFCVGSIGFYFYKNYFTQPQFEVVYLASGDLDIGRCLSKNIYVKNFKNDESTFDYIAKYAEESLPIKDPKLDIGEIIFFNSKEAANAIQAVPKIDDKSPMGFPLYFNYVDKPENTEKYKQSIIAIYFRLPNEDPKFIKFPHPAVENPFEN